MKFFLSWFLAIVLLVYNVIHTNNNVASSDVGCFSAVAFEMKEGKVLYKDVFDNKAPGIFFIHLLFQKITSDSPIYIGILNSSFLALAFFFFSLLLSRHLNVFDSIVINIFIWTNFVFLKNQWEFFLTGGYTEEIGCYCLVVSISLFYLGKDLHIRNSLLSFFLSGFFIGMSIFIKEPFIFVYLVFLILFVFMRKQSKIKNLISFHLGICLVFVSFLIYLFKNDSFSNYFAYLKFASLYAFHKGVFIQSDAIIKLFDYYWNVYKFLIVPGLILLIFKFSRNMVFKTFKNSISFGFFLVLITLFSFIVLGEVTYNHYYIPILVIGLCIFLKFVLRSWIVFKQINIVLGLCYLILIIFSECFIFNDNLKLNYNNDLHISQEYKIPQFTAFKNSHCFVDNQELGRFYYMFNLKNNLKFPCPYYIYFLEQENNLLFNEIVLQNQKTFQHQFIINPPKFIVSKFELSPAFYYLALNLYVEKNYFKRDSCILNGNKYYIRERIIE